MECCSGLQICRVRNYAPSLLFFPSLPFALEGLRKTCLPPPLFSSRANIRLFLRLGGIVCNASKKGISTSWTNAQPYPACPPKESTSVIKLGPSESIVNVSPSLYAAPEFILVYSLEHVLCSQVRADAKALKVW